MAAIVALGRGARVLVVVVDMGGVVDMWVKDSTPRSAREQALGLGIMRPKKLLKKSRIKIVPIKNKSKTL